MSYVYACATQAESQANQDAHAVLQKDDRLIIIVADGAGGIGGGAAASAQFVRDVEARVDSIDTAAGWVRALSQIDCAICQGETTGIVLDITEKKIVGSSVGDSQARIYDFDQEHDLTEVQVRKPLLGTGDARPCSIEGAFTSGILIAGTDGFWNYAKRDVIMAEAPHLPFPTSAKKLLDMARLPSGALWDDTTVIVVKRAR